jgi:hypothetical protein
VRNTFQADAPLALSETTFLSPAAAAARLPGRPHPSTVLRWVLVGVVRDGLRVRLAARRVGGRWRIDPVDLDAFLRTLNFGFVSAPDAGHVDPPPAGLGPADREARRRHIDAKRELRRRGVLS